MTMNNIHHDIPRLKLLGIGYSETRALKTNLLLALQELGLNVILEEVEDIDKLMQYDISGIPALIFDGQVILQKQVPNVETLKGMIKKAIGNANHAGD